MAVTKREESKTMTTWFVRLKRIIFDSEFVDELEQAKRHRIESQKVIKQMVADLNGCSDSWFLTPKETIHDCVQKGDGGR